MVLGNDASDVRIMLRPHPSQAPLATDHDALTSSRRDMYIRASALGVTSSRRRITLPELIGQLSGSDSPRLGIWCCGLHSSAPSISFAPIAQARLPLDLADRYRLYRLRPGDSPQTLQTPPHGGRPVLRRLPLRLPLFPSSPSLGTPAPSEALPPPLATDPAWDGPAGL